MDNEELNKIFRKAADSVSYTWPEVIEVDDLAQELWIWYLESPSVRRMLAGLPKHEGYNLIVRQGHNLASAARDRNARFSGRIRYIPADVVCMLESRGRISPEMRDDLEDGMNALRDRTGTHTAALTARFVNKAIPESKTEQKQLERAVNALTEEMNRAVRAKFERMTPIPGGTLGDGPGTRRTAFPNDFDQVPRNIFDDEFRGEEMDQYRGWVQPEIFPEVRPALVENWDEYAQEDFGGK
ncbi:hypothetical protein [Nocardia grenadensis]|uniref:hypothetical protein n=1 Tax=Nocardia grenadensis TaxID=931537 RepID=UPI003D74CE27